MESRFHLNEFLKCTKKMNLRFVRRVPGTMPGFMNTELAKFSVLLMVIGMKTTGAPLILSELTVSTQTATDYFIFNIL
jgi:hypothetical protein